MGLDTSTGHPQPENTVQLWQNAALPLLETEQTSVLEPESGTQTDRPATQTQVVARSLAEKQEEPMPPSPYPKRLIEVDLPIKRISAHARREKSIRHGHISTLHIWWARRPLAACRSVICAALWLDPVDPQCPQVWRDRASELIVQFAQRVNSRLEQHHHTSSLTVWQALAKPENWLDPNNPAHWMVLRERLLDLIADFANWDNSTHPDYLEISRSLTQAAHEALGGEPGTKPLVVDPFAGGGSILLEALRVGADAFASDLNPVAVLLNKVVLEYIPKYGQRLADEVRKWGQWVKEEAEKELAEFYPKDADGSTPIAYLWARTILSEAPDDGVGIPIEVPLMRSLWLSKKPTRYTALRWVRDEAGRVQTETVEVTYANGKTRQVRRPLLEILNPQKPSEVENGTVARGSATCPVTGFTTPVASVRRQLKERKGGASDARMTCVVSTNRDAQGRFYRLPNTTDLKTVERASEKLKQQTLNHQSKFSLVPDELLDIRGIRHTWAMIYGLDRWSHYFVPRQAITLVEVSRLVSLVGDKVASKHDSAFARAVQTCLALIVDKIADKASSLCRWKASAEYMAGNTFGRQALPLVWDFCEASPLGRVTGDIGSELSWVSEVLTHGIESKLSMGQAEQVSATLHPLLPDMVDALITDPPYYDSVPYAYLSDFFYVWLRRALGQLNLDLLKLSLIPKDEEIVDEEIVVDRPHELSNSKKNIIFYEKELEKAFEEGRRILRPSGIGTIVFASKTTTSWEAILQAVIDAGLIVTASWAIDTEMTARIAAQGQARLASSIHLVCRPRENADGSLKEAIGDWRDVLQELPQRIHDWMPRLSDQGVVGADAIFACLGPALEIFSRYSRVEKASGEPVSLKEYLGYVWAAVSKEALSTIFEGADASGFEEDARLTAIWFWVLKAAAPDKPETADADAEELQEEAETDEEEKPAGQKKSAGYVMEYDAVRKLAQGLGADLGKLSRPGSILVIKGNLATLNTIASRESYLLGSQLSLFNGEQPIYSKGKRGKKDPTVTMQAIESRQMNLFAEPLQLKPQETDQLSLPSLLSSDDRPLLERLLSSGVTVLDRLHQAMLLFGRAQTALLGPFLIATTMADNPHFW